MKLEHLNNDQVHQVACLWAAAEGVVQGLRVELKPEARRYRLDVNGKLSQVLSKRTAVWQVTNWSRPLEDDTHAVILVDLQGDQPDFFVVPADWFGEDIRQHHEAFLSEHGGTRPRSPDSAHHKVEMPRVTEWHAKWDVLR